MRILDLNRKGHYNQKNDTKIKNEVMFIKMNFLI